VGAQGAGHYRAIVDRFERVARMNLETPARLADLCGAVGISRRTLARAVRAVHATTPVRYLHGLRLAKARCALASADAAATTVTQIATRFGFRELGRFARDYRITFGEAPSATLRRASAANPKFASACGKVRLRTSGSKAALES
jgi:transcriptional regulator GlxA family with amidase domain